MLILILSSTAGFAGGSINPAPSELEASTYSEIATLQPEIQTETNPVAVSLPPVLLEGALPTVQAHSPEDLLEKKYYESVQANAQELAPWLQFGVYTRDTLEIRELADRLYKSEDILFLDGSRRKMQKTEDPIKDYIIKSLHLVSGSIHTPQLNEKYRKLYLGQVPADEVLKNRIGWCDEKSILFASLLRVKGIPNKIVVRKYAPSDYFYGTPEAHSENLVWWNNAWIKTDPSFAKLGEWAANGEDITHEDNIFMSDVEKW